MKTAHVTNIDEDGATCVRCQPMMVHRRNEKIIRGSNGGTDCDGHEKEKVGMVRAREKQI